MSIVDGMGNRRGSAIVFAMLLLVLLSAAGMYAVSLPVSVGEVSQQQYHAAVARNLARAGAHAAIACLPKVFSGPAPYVRSMPVGPMASGRYSVTSRRTGGGKEKTASGEDSGYEDYALVSEGSVSGDPGSGFRVRAEIRYRTLPSPDRRPRILKWEETGPR
ncbi:MAG: hypothetical protein ACM319_00895 [Deltaproteobacteria bacterium]|nr:hypothetical protein [Candidatus Deferrimicrobiaceae bacterium]